MLPRSKIETKLDEEILRTLEKLSNLQPNSQEYATTVTHIAKLHELKTTESFKIPSMDTVLYVGANLVGILWLTTFERDRPLTSKALNFVLKPR